MGIKELNEILKKRYLDCDSLVHSDIDEKTNICIYCYRHASYKDAWLPYLASLDWLNGLTNLEKELF